MIRLTADEWDDVMELMVDSPSVLALARDLVNGSVSDTHVGAVMRRVVDKAVGEVYREEDEHAEGAS